MYEILILKTFRIFNISFVNKTSLNGTIAYAISMIADIKETDKILDCFCRSGEIGIELAHHLIGKSVHFYAKDKFRFKKMGWDIDLNKFDSIEEKELEIYNVDSAMPNVKAAEKNSKISGINKIIKFSRIPIEDLDLKFNNNIDKIIVQLPAFGKDREGKLLEIYEEFFKICSKVLTKNGTITCIGIRIDPVKEIAKNFGYSVKLERSIMQGKEVMIVMGFKRSKNDKKSK